MSVQAITWALDYPAGSVTEKVILLVLANYANEYGISWPSQKTLADQSACTDRTVRTILSRLEGQGVVQRVTRRRDNGSRRSDIILLSAFEGRKPAPPGMFDGDPNDPCEQAERRSASSPNRKGFPGGNRKGFPHPPETASALDTSKILKSASLRTQPESRRACLAVAGPGLDREAEASSISAFEIARWIEAGCDLALDILPVIAAKSLDARSAPIRGWSFFTPAILEAKARRETPLPQPTEVADEHASPHRKAKHHKSTARDSSHAWNAAVEKADRARAAQTDPDA
ncbi:MAG: helix-turn-helix domain-containing protein [Cypionkella sp.]